jgi:hypothetical protein
MNNITSKLSYGKIAIWFTLAIVSLLFYRFGFGIAASMDYCIDEIDPADIYAFHSVVIQIVIVLVSVIIYEILRKLLTILKANRATVIIIIPIYIISYGILFSAPMGGQYQTNHSKKIKMNAPNQSLKGSGQ